MNRKAVDSEKEYILSLTKQELQAIMEYIYAKHHELSVDTLNGLSYGEDFMNSESGKKRRILSRIVTKVKSATNNEL